MNSSQNTIYNARYAHVYVEREAMQYPLTAQLLSALSARKSRVINIGHYMDLFGRTHQSFTAQKNAPALILAVKHGNFIYPGAPVCQNFGHAHFYYTSFAMNCPFDCEYCYLQGMYPSSNIVLFVNQEDYFAELKQLLLAHPVYLCISYDTDLLALEQLTGFIRRYLSFAANEPDLTTELRTKSAVSVSGLLSEDSASAAGSAAQTAGLSPSSSDTCRETISSAPASSSLTRFIMAYTLSPESVIARFEHCTPPLAARLSAIRAAHAAGFPIRLCFDPLLAVPEFETVYRSFLSQVQEALADIPIQDASIGVFRISDSYLKQMRKNRPSSALLQYPFTNEAHVCHYGARSERMISFVKEELAKWIAPEKIYAR